MRMGRIAAALATAGLPAVAVGAGHDGLPVVLPASGYEARVPDDTLDLPRDKADELRRDALARALLWLEPKPDLDLRSNPRDPFGDAEQAICKFHPLKMGGSTAKFACVFAGGEVLKVKYGPNPEIHTEVAATRLLHALGAGADWMYVLKRLRCFGCPENLEMMLSCISSPFKEFVAQCAPLYGEITATGEFKPRIDYSKYVHYETVAVERRLEGKEIEAENKSGWGFDELDKVQVSAREGTRAKRDALRLIAVFLNNWDNRADNQRLLCLTGGARRADGGCPRPFAYMQDVGGTFGRVGGDKEQRKLDLAGWRAVPIWKDAATCRVKIESPPLHGSTFGEAVISERGRSYLAARLRRLTTEQIRDLFEGARFAEYEAASGPERGVDDWVMAFQEKVRQITTRKPCPTP